MSVFLKLKYLTVFLLCIAFVRCDGQEDHDPATVRLECDSSITTSNAYSKLYLDSLVLESFISERDLDQKLAGDLRNFYNGRNYHFAWFTEEGLTEQANAFWSVHKSYVEATRDSSVYDRSLHALMENLLEDGGGMVGNNRDLTEAELDITVHFFQYARTAYQGDLRPADLQWYIPRKKLDLVTLLDTLLSSKEGEPRLWEPASAGYKSMKEQLRKYYAIRQGGGWPLIDAGKQLLKAGDTLPAVAALKKRLAITGDFDPADTSAVFSEELEAALVQAQRRFGLKQDGVAGPATLAQLNIPVEDRIKQMLVNLERMKWMPFGNQEAKLVVNIPEYKLLVYEDGKEQFNMNVVVGKAGTNTVIFSDKLEYVVFSPYWNIPQSIVRNEILPRLRQDPGYLERNNMEQVRTVNGLPVIRQRPGPDNALGRVKFIFPNHYNIYFHDTPAKHLFGRNKRAFSHGCIRLQKPAKLAEYLLSDQAEWNAASIAAAMHSGKEKWVSLKEPLLVLITYFTCWVDEDGKLQFRNDIYGHDKKLMRQLLQ